MEARIGKNQNNDTTFKKQMQNTTQKPTNTSKHKTENKDLSLNHNVTERTEKKLNGTKTGSNQTARLNVKTSVGSGNQHETSVNNVTASTEKDQVEKKPEKHLNVFNTTKTGKKTNKADITLLNDRSTVKEIVEQQLNVISSSEKDKKTNENSTTLTEEGSTGKKIPAKHLNVNTVTIKDKKLHQDNITLLKNGSSLTKKLDSSLNVTTVSDSDKKLLKDDKTTALKEVTPEQKKVETRENVTTSNDKYKNQVNTTLLLEATFGQKKEDKHSNITTLIGKDKKPTQSKTTGLKEKTTEIKNVHGNETTTKEETSGQKKVDKHLNVTTFTEKDKKQKQVIVTHLKDVTSAQKKIEKDLNVPTSTDKNKTPAQVGNNLVKEATYEQKKGKKTLIIVENHLNVTVSTENDNKKSILMETTSTEKGNKTPAQVEKHLNITISSKTDSKTPIQVGKHLNVTTSTEKDSKTPIQVGKHLNVTTSTEKGKKTQTQVGKHLNVTTFTVKGNKTTTQVEKHLNVTTSTEKGKKSQTQVGKHQNVTISTEKDTKTPIQVGQHQNVTTSTKKDTKTPTQVGKHQNVTNSTVKDTKTPIQVGQHQNVTTSTEKGKKTQTQVGKHINVTTFTVKGNKTIAQVEKHQNVTTSLEKNTRTPIQVGKHLNVTTSTVKGKKSQTQVEKHLNVTTSTEKSKKTPTQVGKHLNVTTSTVKGKKSQTQVEKHLNVTTSTEKSKKTPTQVGKHKNANTSTEKANKAPIQVGKHLNVTTSTEKDSKTPIQVRKHLNVTTLTEKDKKSLTQVGKHLNVTTSTVKDTRTPIQVGKHLNVTTSTEKGKKSLTQVEKHKNVTTSTEKDSKTPMQVGKHLNRTTSTQKDTKTPIQAGKHLNITISTEKGKKTPTQVETHLNVTTSPVKGNKTTTQVEKHLNVSISTTKDNKKPTQNETISADKSKNIWKERTSRKINVTIHGEKENKLQQDFKTTTLTLVTSGQRNATTFTKLKKTVKEHLNVTSSNEKDQKLHQGDATLSKKASSEKRKVDSNMGAKMSTEKDKKLPQGDKIKDLRKVTSEKENTSVNVTTSNESDTIIDAHGKKNANSHQKNVITTSDEKHKKLDQSNKRTGLEERTLVEKQEESHVNVSTQTNTHVNRTTRLTDIAAIEVHNITATGFVITWEAPQGIIRNFTVVRREVLSGHRVEDGAEKETATGNELHSSNRTSGKAHTEKAERRSTEKFSQVLAGSARAYHFKNLRPQTKYSVSLYSYGPRMRSKVHHLLVSTGPEPPTELLFNNITETSLLVSWTKPKSTVTGFKVIYINSANGVTGSMAVDSQLSHVLISKLSAGSSYEISVRSVLGAIESEPTTASVVTVPDSPTNLQAVNVTDSKALLLWRPAKAKVDNYYLSYGSSKSSNVTVTVMLSGNSVEHQLRGLHRSTHYTVKIMSQINGLQSSSVSTTFTTASGVKLQVVKPSNVIWNSAVISWRAPHVAFRSYRLTYQKEEDVKEVILNPAVSQYELTDLVASSNYVVKVDGESEGQYISVVSSAFTTAQPPYPYPVECSQVQQNGKKESGEAEIYPEGKDGEPVWVYCDMETAGGGWTVFQRRLDGSLDFFRGWKDYSKGFGNLSAEFWLGNEMLHKLTSLVPMNLWIDLHSGNDTAFAFYSNFTVGSEMAHYVMGLSGYSGTAGNSMSYHNGHPFSTKDKDPSPKNSHCAKSYMGGWWYKNCYKANLNGLYATNSQDQGVVWIDWKGKDVSLPFTEMKLRPASLNHRTPLTQG
ncbi:tenascin-N [Trichomycterus rosablanca]|uniref:tenascin-N n=1 Tax=Trichomycterus rosablanca TaxID=2290929 RepID=UPI002F353CFB